MCVLTAVFLDVISSCEAVLVLSSSLEGLQLSFDEVKVFLVSFPKFNDNFGFFPTIGVPNVLHEGEGAFKAFVSIEDGIKRESLVGADRF